MLNATWKVPAMPTNLAGSNAPGWWFGVQVWSILLVRETWGEIRASHHPPVYH
jgi:hypothetical protein